MKRVKLAAQEVQVMRCIWKRGEATPGEIREDMERLAGRTFERTTISTWLSRLKKKEVIYVCRKGPVYQALMTEEDYVKQEMGDFVDYWFDGSAPRFFAAFCENEQITKADAEEMRRMIEQMEE